MQWKVVGLGQARLKAAVLAVVAWEVSMRAEVEEKVSKEKSVYVAANVLGEVKTALLVVTEMLVTEVKAVVVISSTLILLGSDR